MKRTHGKRRRSTSPRSRPNARARRAAAAFARLVRVMQTLRSPEGCPWDREQTHASLRPHLLEETYEAIETIDRGDMEALPAELGDVLFQCVFHAQIAAEEGRFDIADAVDAIFACRSRKGRREVAHQAGDEQRARRKALEPRLCAAA